MLDKIKDNLAISAFIVSTLVVGVLYYLLGRKDKKISKLVYDLQKQKVKDQIKTLQKKVSKDKKEYARAKKTYDDLKRRYPELTKRLKLRKPGN